MRNDLSYSKNEICNGIKQNSEILEISEFFVIPNAPPPAFMMVAVKVCFLAYCLLNQRTRYC